MNRDGLTDELRTILERQAAAGSRRAAWALHAARGIAETIARTGCRFACTERGASAYCAHHTPITQEGTPHASGSNHLAD